MLRARHEESQGEDSEEGKNASRIRASDIPEYLKPFVSCYDFDDPTEMFEGGEGVHGTSLRML